MIERRAIDATDVDALFDSGAPLDRAVESAARQAIGRHKALNQAIVIWRNAAPAIIPPDQIELHQSTSEPTSDC